MKLSKQVIEVCKIGTGESCCKYLSMDGNGFGCLKVDEHFKAIIDCQENMMAQGDNCDGVEGAL